MFHGSNYDTQSGKKLALDDVVKHVNNELAEAVEKELTSHMRTCEFYSEYTVALPMNISFFSEWDAYGALEEISLSSWCDNERHHYVDYGIYTDTDGQYYYEECYVSGLHPYYVRTADGHYVYLFREDYEEGWRQMNLVVLSLNADGSITKSGEMNVIPSWLTDNKFTVPTDHGRLILDDTNNGAEKDFVYCLQ